MTLPVLPSWLQQPADATAVAPKKAPETLEQILGRWGHVGRQALAGAAEGLAQVPLQVADAFSFAQRPGTPARAPLYDPRAVGDVVGGPAKTVSDSSFRDIGSFAGNNLGWMFGGAALGEIPTLKTADVNKPSVRKLVAALSEEGGATLHPNGQRFAGTGFAVADPDFTAYVKSPKEMKAFLARRDVKNAMDAGKLIGKWTDPETGVTEVNLTDVVPDQKAAMKLAAQRGEQAVGQLENGSYQGDVRNPHAPVNAVKQLLEGLRTGPQMKRITEIPTTRGRQLAQAYESLPKNDPAARAAYDALNAEVAKQYQAMQDAGYTVEFTDADPYKNSAEMMKDVRENKTLKVFKTPRPEPLPPGGHMVDGKWATPQQEVAARRADPVVAAAIRTPDGRYFEGPTHGHAFMAMEDAGEGALADQMQRANTKHDLFKTASGRYVTRDELQREWGGRRPVSELMRLDEPAPEQPGFHPYMTPEQTDRFRAVHDFLAHAGGGNQFGAVGEENAYRVHASTLSDLAKRALASETRGQNSWVNFGPNSHLPVKERPFAEQKAALFPEHLLGDYDQMGITGPPAIRVNNEWQPTERGVFDRSPEQGVPAGEYREPAPLPFETQSRPKAGPTELAQQIATDPRVERRIVSDMEKGLPLGGRDWYGLLPLRRYLANLRGGMSFADFNQAGAAGSARTPTHNELTNTSILLYAKAHGISYEEARQAFLQKYAGISKMKPTFMGMHGQLFDRAQELGYAGPASPTAGELKIPNYYHDRMLKANGLAIDTHEITMMGQALGLEAKYGRKVARNMVREALADAESYNLATSPYIRTGHRFGLFNDQVQAGRWIGGGPLTGLKSQPKGDFLQTMEDGLLYKAQMTGHDTSPRGLRSLFDAIARGEDFFLPTPTEGGFPVY